MKRERKGWEEKEKGKRKGRKRERMGRECK
jgi:hypothetical protein